MWKLNILTFINWSERGVGYFTLYTLYYRWPLAAWMDSMSNVAFSWLYALSCINTNGAADNNWSLFIRLSYCIIYQVAVTRKSSNNNYMFLAYSCFYIWFYDLWLVIDVQYGRRVILIFFPFFKIQSSISVVCFSHCCIC